MFTVIIQTTVFCLLTLCRTIPKYSNVYFYIFCEKQNFWISWVLTGGAMCEVQNKIVVKPFTLFTETLTFYFQKCLGFFFKYVSSMHTPNAFKNYFLRRKDRRRQILLKLYIDCFSLQHFSSISIGRNFQFYLMSSYSSDLKSALFQHYIMNYISNQYCWFYLLNNFTF